MGKNSTNSKIIQRENWEHEQYHTPGWNIFAAFEVTLMNLRIVKMYYWADTDKTEQFNEQFGRSDIVYYYDKSRQTYVKVGHFRTVTESGLDNAGRSKR